MGEIGTHRNDAQPPETVVLSSLLNATTPGLGKRTSQEGGDRTPEEVGKELAARVAEHCSSPTRVCLGRVGCHANDTLTGFDIDLTCDQQGCDPRMVLYAAENSLRHGLATGALDE